MERKLIAPVYRKKFIIVLSTITFISVINGSGFNIAIPAIARDFGLTPSEVSWVASGYIIIFALASVTYGKLADMFPVKNLITLGLVLFSGGSLIGFFSHEYVMLIIGRMIQASGAAAIPSLEMLAATRYFPDEQRGRVLGLVASVVSFGAGIGPVVGGFIAGALHWRFIFLAALVTVGTIPFVRRWLPEETRQPGKLDLPGAALLGAAVGALLLFISQFIWWLLPLSVLFVIGLMIHLRRTWAPFVNPSLFRNGKFRNGLIAAFLSVATVFGMLFAVPVMLEGLHHLDSTKIGLVMFPGAMSAAIIGMIGGRWMDNIGSTGIVYISIGCFCLGYLLLSTFAGIAPGVTALALILPYFGFAFIQSGLPGAVLGVLSRDESGIGVGLYNLVFFMAGAFGSGIVGKVLDYSSFDFAINPLVTSGAAAIYSNVFFVFVFINLLALSVFAAAYHSRLQREQHISR